MKNIAKLNTISITSLIGYTFLLIYITDRYVLTISFYENNGNPFPIISGQVNDVYSNLQKWIYISSALYLIIKLCLVSLVLYTALYLSDQVIVFQKVFLITTLAEFIFLIPAILKIWWFHHYYPHGTLSDWHNVYILSALSLLKSAPTDWSYALQTLNVFEIAYWFLLSLGIYKFSGMTYDKSLRLVIFAYVPALFIWVAVITFITLMLFPAIG